MLCSGSPAKRTWERRGGQNGLVARREKKPTKRVREPRTSPINRCLNRCRSARGSDSNHVILSPNSGVSVYGSNARGSDNPLRLRQSKPPATHARERCEGCFRAHRGFTEPPPRAHGSGVRLSELLQIRRDKLPPPRAHGSGVFADQSQLQPGDAPATRARERCEGGAHFCDILVVSCCFLT